ncbi:hypothetical protein [Teredinibacter franksiae]|uniref:hypothetical protein n=1 Tax=Teredinibacter franksiae TaxID=2761453 RepID=UPI00162891C4|nr:hypothetical protein [Teredinibacter franksiae]
MTDIDEKLSKLATGQLNAQDEHEMKKMLENDAELKQEFEFMSALHTGFQQDDMKPPGEMGLARLKRDIQNEQAQKNQQQKIVTKKQHRVWRPVAIAACCLLALQVILYLPKELSDTTPNMVPLSGGESHQTASLQIVFKQHATALQIQQALSAVQAQIVNGPGALGIYSLATPTESDNEQISVQLQTLDFVEEVIVIAGGAN